MRSSKLLRCCSLALLVVASFGIISVAAAQDATAEPTEDAMMSEMMSMEGACPEGKAASLLEEMSMEMGTTDMEGTEEPMAEATHDMSDMDMTEEPSMEATMEMTDEAGAMGVTCFFAELEGANEVPGPGDEDGYGVAFVSIDASSGTVCYDVAVANITLPAAAQHIHVNAEGQAGPVVVPFPTAPDEQGMASGCTTADTEGLLETIVSNPEGYYVNVHTSDFPDGAVRGQLMSWEDHEMMEGDDMGGTSSESGGSDTGSTDAEMTPEATASS
jgi:hypothetical protein